MMSEKTYGLSQKAMTEKYEDLLFTKVMALYAEKESELILAEMEAENAENLPKPDPAAIDRLYSKRERKENLSTLWRFSKKIITFAAMVVFVAFVSLSSVVVASAEAREAVAEAIYHLVLEEHEEYTRVSIGESTGFVDPEIYDWEGAFAPTYIPEGYVLSNFSGTSSQHSVDYVNNENFIAFIQANNSISQVDTEDADIVEEIIIGDSNGIFVTKGELTRIVWNIGATYLEVIGTAAPEEIIKIAESIKPIGKTESEEPAEEYIFIDPEIYDWEGAFAPTYVPDNYNYSEKIDIGNEKIVIYSKGEKEIIFSQSVETTVEKVDTENAELVEEIAIGESNGIYVVKNGITSIFWNCENTLLSVVGNADSHEILQMAQGIKLIN